MVAADFSNNQTSDMKALKQRLDDLQKEISDLENTWAASLSEVGDMKIFTPHAEAIADFIKENELPSEMAHSIHSALFVMEGMVLGFNAVQHTFLHSLIQDKTRIDFDAFRRISSLESLVIQSTDLLWGMPDLSSCNKLKVIYLDGCNNLQNIEFVYGLPSLDNLRLNGCRQIDDFLPLANSGIRTLAIGDTKFSKLEDLSSIKSQLESLDISNTNLVDFDFIENFKSLDTLLANKLATKDLSVVGKLVGLIDLVLDDTVATDYDFLENLVNLRGLSLVRCRIGDLRILKNCHFLQELGLLDAEIESLEPLTDLPIENLVLGNAEGLDLSPLLRMKNLKQVMLITGESASQQEDILKELTSSGVRVEVVG